MLMERVSSARAASGPPATARQEHVVHLVTAELGHVREAIDAARRQGQGQRGELRRTPRQGDHDTAHNSPGKRHVVDAWRRATGEPHARCAVNLRVG